MFKTSWLQKSVRYKQNLASLTGDVPNTAAFTPRIGSKCSRLHFFWRLKIQLASMFKEVQITVDMK